MNEADIYTLLSNTIMAILYACLPILGLALLTGLVIAFFQALTQVQEMTLTFVPKIFVIFIVAIVAAPFMYDQVRALAETGFDMIASGNL